DGRGPHERGHRRDAGGDRGRGREARLEHLHEARAAALRARPPTRAGRAHVDEGLRYALAAFSVRALDTTPPRRRAVTEPRRPCRTVQAMERRTKIVATIGPASRDPEVLVRMVEAGMDVARLNFSHGTADLHAETAQRVREAAGRAGRPVAILQDLPGPKLRIGALKDDTAELAAGDCVTFVCGNGSPPGDERRMSIAWDGLAHAIDPGEILYLADGSVRLRAVAVRAGDGEIDAEVEVGGTVASRQGLNIPGPLDILPA